MFTDDGEFLMYAHASPEMRKVQFFPYDPEDKSCSLFDLNRPGFTLTWNEKRTDWSLVKEKCEHCQFSPRHLSCGACRGKQQVAFIRQARADVGDGIFNCMEVRIPGLYSDESRVIWCPKLGRGNLGSESLDSSHEWQHLANKMPVWNDEVESLVLDFRGRNVISSAKNFQLFFGDQPEHMICQYGKIGNNHFSLDFVYPLSCIQAFGVALTAMFWA